MKKYIHQFLLGIDQLANTLFGGWADETLSARAWRQQHKTHWKVMRNLIDTMFFWQEEHCHKAYLSEQERRQLPPEYRGEVK